MTFQDLFLELVEADMGVMLSMLLVAAMLIGGMLRMTGTRPLHLFTGTITMVVFLAFYEIMRRQLHVAQTGIEATSRSYYLMLITGGLYLIGLIVGIIIVAITSRPYLRERKECLKTAQKNGFTSILNDSVET